MPDKRKSKMVEFSSETVIFDEKGNRVIACPTEQEAVEYVREQEQEADREGCEYHECNKPVLHSRQNIWRFYLIGGIG